MEGYTDKRLSERDLIWQSQNKHFINDISGSYSEYQSNTSNNVQVIEEKMVQSYKTRWKSLAIWDQ